MNQTPKEIIYMIVITEALLAFIGVSSLSLSLFYKTYADPAILTALIAITGGLVGSLGTILSNTRQTVGTTTQQSTTVSPPSGPLPPNGGGPTPVEVVNAPTAPVPVHPTP